MGLIGATISTGGHSEEHLRCAITAWNIWPHAQPEWAISSSRLDSDMRSQAALRRRSAAGGRLRAARDRTRVRARNREPSSVYSLRRLGTKVARFRRVNEGLPCRHHDALELPGGQTVLLSSLRQGQWAIVLQLPAAERRHEAERVTMPEISAA